MAKPTTKATRVHTAEVVVTDHCPVCRHPVMGTATVEAHLGDMELEVTEGGGIEGHQSVRTRVREFRVTHVCQPPTVTAATGASS